VSCRDFSWFYLGGLNNESSYCNAKLKELN